VILAGNDPSLAQKGHTGGGAFRAPESLPDTDLQTTMPKGNSQGGGARFKSVKIREGSADGKTGRQGFKRGERVGKKGKGKSPGGGALRGGDGGQSTN